MRIKPWHGAVLGVLAPVVVVCLLWAAVQYREYWFFIWWALVVVFFGCAGWAGWCVARDYADD